jgi:hypothetical protein
MVRLAWIGSKTRRHNYDKRLRKVRMGNEKTQRARRKGVKKAKGKTPGTLLTIVGYIKIMVYYIKAYKESKESQYSY